ncbi:10370_t:CDS:2 [Cetraspora pellucida]|uniref:10370_t:CDS:1 n=1 Tax=Cetraspora pellucida TaxID=1433469 RepID=A0A9N9DDP8_9GLOM|nr:10370_t:CDS:2 [Cetraspora pellucida]
MSTIATKIIEKYKLTPNMDIFELSQYTSEFLKNLTDDRKRNQARRRLWDGFKFSDKQVSILIPNQRSEKGKIINVIEGSCKIAIASPPKDLEEEIIREITKRILQNRYGFSENQVNDLFSIQKNDQCENTYCESASGKTLNIAISNKPSKRIEETIGEMAQQILQNKLTIRDVRAEAYALALLAKNANAGSSRLTRLRRELRNLNASLEIIEVTKFPDITEDANKIQSVNRKKAKAKCIDYPDEFTLESVKERLDAYDIKTLSDCQALADVMVMLCIRPAELKTLHITDAGVTGYAKNRAKELLTWIQHAISSERMGDPDKPGVKWSSYGVEAHEAKNMAHAYTIAGECLRHSSDNHTSPVQNYIVVNYRKKGVPYKQAR